MTRLFLAAPVLLVGLVLIVVAAWGGDRAVDVGAGVPPDGVVVAATPVAPVAPLAPVAAVIAPRPDPLWVARVAARTGIVAPAMTAYAAASLRMRDEQPRCRLGWTTLAGIGQVETGHGQGRLDAAGRSTDTIDGPVLDGSDGNAAISEGGTWDRARGPMQFIASTWQRWASDGDGDGTSDVDDVDDAAYAAARYLCFAGGDLTTGAGWSRAVFAYNHSDDYVRAVLGAANAYAARSTTS